MKKNLVMSLVLLAMSLLLLVGCAHHSGDDDIDEILNGGSSGSNNSSSTGSSGVSGNSYSPYYDYDAYDFIGTVAEAAAYITGLKDTEEKDGDGIYYILVIDSEETDCSELKEALDSFLGNTEPYIVLDLSGATELDFSVDEALTSSTGSSDQYRRFLLQEIILPEGCTVIGSYAFAHHRGLKKVTLPSTVTEIGDYAFYSTDLESINLEDTSVESIGCYAFANSQNKSFTEISLPITLKEIGREAFGDNSYLTTINIPKKDGYGWGHGSTIGSGHSNANENTKVDNPNISNLTMVNCFETHAGHFLTYYSSSSAIICDEGCCEDDENTQCSTTEACSNTKCNCYKLRKKSPSYNNSSTFGCFAWWYRVSTEE